MFVPYSALVLLLGLLYLRQARADLKIPGDQYVHTSMHDKLFVLQTNSHLSPTETLDQLQDLKEFYSVNKFEDLNDAKKRKVQELLDASEVDGSKCNLDGFGELDRLKRLHKKQASIEKYLEHYQRALSRLCLEGIEAKLEKSYHKLDEEEKGALDSLRSSLPDVGELKGSSFYVDGVVTFLENKLGPIDVFVKRQSHQDGLNQIYRVFDREIGQLCVKVNASGRELFGGSSLVHPSNYLASKLLRERLQNQYRNLVNCHNIVADVNFGDKIYNIASSRSYRPNKSVQSGLTSKLGSFFKLY